MLSLHDVTNTVLSCLSSIYSMFSTSYEDQWYYTFNTNSVVTFAVRECVQISASGHADANQSDANFFPIPFAIGTDWNGIGNGSDFFN